MVVGIALAGWVLVTVVIVIREWLAMKRLDWLGDIRQRADHALKPSSDLELAREAIRDLLAVYGKRKDIGPGCQLVDKKLENIFPGATLIDFAEQKVLTELDDRAKQVISTTALRVATETTFMPWPLAPGRWSAGVSRQYANVPPHCADLWQQAWCCGQLDVKPQGAGPVDGCRRPVHGWPVAGQGAG